MFLYIRTWYLVIHLRNCYVGASILLFSAASQGQEFRSSGGKITSSKVLVTYVRGWNRQIQAVFE